MFALIKWFWNSLDIKNWTFEGNKMAPLYLIIWRIIWAVPLIISRYLFVAIVLIRNGRDEAERMMNWVR